MSERGLLAGDLSGLMPDAVLDDPGFLVAQEGFWTAAVTDERLAVRAK